MNIIVVSLARAKDRRERMKKQLEDLELGGIIIDAVDGQELSEEEKNKRLHLQGGYRYGELFQPGELGCTMSHINALKLAREKNWEHLIVLEDDIILAEDFKKRVKLLFSIVQNDWEHIYLSGTIRSPWHNPNLNFPNTVPSINTECTHSMIIRDSAYNKVIDYLSLFETTTDDSYNQMIKTGSLRSYTYYPFVTYAADDFTYIWDHSLDREHPSKKFFKNKLW